MEGREQGDQGFDDWFDEPEPAAQPRRRGSRRAAGPGPAEDDVWTIPDAQARSRGRTRRQSYVVGGRSVTTTQLAVAGASAVALLLAVLAAAGAFSSGPAKQATPPPTLPATTVTVTTTSTPSTTGTKAPTTTLKPGDTGAQVKLLQQALTTLGYSPGQPDGSYGPGTKTAVMNFQTASGLTADGVVGPKTLQALTQALAASSSG